ncbi:MAG: phosphoadenylyl-sulfate reductase, partial [Armatimonadetes bacterium]|nr:phosphoadenylyl-sulfate reductase [Armatimonadota bacterium]NIM23733.1 phosphoadenylyl-sulfate reductase [Armatimonadota bacterium]NIM67610.1 phosphoadenylyl-sulfate reductase [Armatimonadota bacterium]NIM76133.1 phosphoadenylyl-sulfate reductase [Armatimonadota bacterium]NIN05816.1 phosphoadenylyl-sulfate reductase [Armatimonadota bacterium]
MLGRSPEQVLKWASDKFGGRIALACSFGAEDVVLVDMFCRITQKPRVFALDTGRLHEATYEVMEQVRDRYGINIEAYYPEREIVEELERQHGFYSFRKSLEGRHQCCKIRKVEPLSRALSGLDAWITGLRREQSVTRTEMQVVEEDEGHGGIIKLNPLIDWTNDQVWEYIRQHDVPYNRLHDEGFPSIGCEPCTRAVAPGEHPRAGRWW